MKYPRYSAELLATLKEDQREVRECSRAFRAAAHSSDTYDIRDRFTRSSAARVKKTFEILDLVGEPTIANIGSDASQAVSVLALHARLSDMKKILSLYEESYRKDPKSVYYEAIPSLTDRILIIERKKQRFGTQWMLGADGRFFLPSVEDFRHMNDRRAEYGLGESKHPIDLTNGVPEHEPPRPVTQASDQREPTDQEYQDFVYGSLD